MINLKIQRTVMQQLCGIWVKDMPECKCIWIFYGWYSNERSEFILGLDICLPLSNRQLKNKDLTQAGGLSLSCFSPFDSPASSLKSKTTTTTKPKSVVFLMTKFWTRFQEPGVLFDLNSCSSPSLSLIWLFPDLVPDGNSDATEK